MASPAYANDLTTIATGDLNYDAGTFDESSDGGWDTAGSMVDDEDLWYVDTLINTGEAASSCTAAQYTKDGTGSGTSGPGTIIYNHNTAFTVPTDGIVSIDNYWAAPPALNPYAGTFGTAEAGVSVLIGSSLGDFDVHYVAGSDKFPATDGVYTTYFVDPTLTPAGTVGTVTTYTAVGIAIAAGAQARGNPNAVQSIRYGRAEVEYTIGDSTTPATFGGYALIDNLLADKFNLLQEIEGGYKARGLMTFGTATTAVYFKDSDVSIVIADDLKVGSAFNKGVVNNASSELYWINISITNLGAVSKYTFTVNDNAITNHTGCVLTDLGVFSYGSNSTEINTTYRRQESIIQGGSTITSCTFDSSIAEAALIVSNLNLVTKCTFNSSGLDHAVDLGTISTTQSLSWDNYESGYTDASLGDETILVDVDSGITLTINILTGASTPSYYNVGTGIVSIVAGLVTATFNVSPSITDYEYALYTVTASGSLVGATEVQHAEVHGSDTFGYTYTYSAGTILAVQLLFGDGSTNDYEEYLEYYELSSANQTIPVNLTVDNNN